MNNIVKLSTSDFHLLISSVFTFVWIDSTVLLLLDTSTLSLLLFFSPKGEKPHKCSLCDFRCRDESYLSKHMLTHSDDKNFMCAECGYVTKWKHYLNVHMRKHAGDLR